MLAICKTIIKKARSLIYRIVDFFKVHKFHEFRGCWLFVKFNPSKKPTTHCSVWAFSRPIRENIIVKKPKISHSRNLSTSKKTNYTVSVVFDSFPTLWSLIQLPRANQTFEDLTPLLSYILTISFQKYSHISSYGNSLWLLI